MQCLIKYIVYTFLIITIFTALLTLGGIIMVWIDSSLSLPYLETLVVTLLIEAISCVFMFARKGLGYLPQVVTNKTKEQTIKFLEDFISSGSSASIYSSRVSWLIGNKPLQEILNKKIEEGLKVEIITSNEINEEIKVNLPKASFFVTRELVSPSTRFTLINGERSGAERLAIAKGSHPNHEITIFDTNSGPQIIGMAKDLIRKSKAL